MRVHNARLKKISGMMLTLDHCVVSRFPRRLMVKQLTSPSARHREGPFFCLLLREVITPVTLKIAMHSKSLESHMSNMV